jgi:hypothetical protein
MHIYTHAYIRMEITIVFENFTASIGDLMVANWVYWRRVSGASKRIFATMKSIQLSPKSVCASQSKSLHSIAKHCLMLPMPDRDLPYVYIRLLELEISNINICILPCKCRRINYWEVDTHGTTSSPAEVITQFIGYVYIYFTM